MKTFHLFVFSILTAILPVCAQADEDILWKKFFNQIELSKTWVAATVDSSYTEEEKNWLSPSQFAKRAKLGKWVNGEPLRRIESLPGATPSSKTHVSSPIANHPNLVLSGITSRQREVDQIIDGDTWAVYSLKLGSKKRPQTAKVWLQPDSGKPLKMELSFSASMEGTVLYQSNEAGVSLPIRFVLEHEKLGMPKHWLIVFENLDWIPRPATELTGLNNLYHLQLDSFQVQSSGRNK
ncbi:hypothetical protein ACO0LM_25020 [Undibacterium sp. Di26W]|uniref:hypothetical protein n=1 Tax=Undibacterium sp. Di26W TaxID=3413035 RepID=UPI003BF14CF4